MVRTWQRFGSLAIALLATLVTGDRAAARDEAYRCQQVREVRALALQTGLDGQNLATLENLYCQRSRPSHPSRRPETSRDCQILTMMAQLARIEAGQDATTRAVLGQQQAACNLASGSMLSPLLRYPNGQVVRFGSTWHYPNGQRAQFGSIWNYPSGTQAKFGSTWNYPNGATARFGDRWRYPNGSLVSEQQAVSWACALVPAAECNQRLQEARRRSGDSRDLVILELIWRAYQLGGRP